MKKRFFTYLLAGTMLITSLTGCGGLSGSARADIPLPDNYYVPPLEETEDETSDPKEDEEAAVTSGSKETAGKENEAPPKEELPTEPAKNSIRFFLDTSGSMKRSPEVVNVHSAASKCAAGFKERHFYGMDSSKGLVEVTEQLALSGQYGTGAPIDLIGQDCLDYDASGVNIITTDLQSNTSCSEIGRWLVETGCTGYSFYVFTMQYNGSLEFETYTSNSVRGQVSISGCSFPDKEFLMIVFGDNRLVEDYDTFFLSKLAADMDYDFCHVSLHNNTENLDSFLSLTSSKAFTRDVANITYDNTNYLYGLAPADTEDITFTCDNTFVFRKNSKSANQARKGVKAILYAVPDPGVEIPAVKEAIITSVQEYDKQEGVYKDSKVPFEIDTTPYLDGFPSAVEAADADSEKSKTLNEKLGGNIVENGPVFTVTVKNQTLPKGLYAVEAQVIFEATGEVIDLQKFSAAHNAGLEDYTAALLNECRPKESDGQISTSSFIYTGNGNGSVFRKLLEFERLTDELIAAGAVSESNNEQITLRLIIDNR